MAKLDSNLIGEHTSSKKTAVSIEYMTCTVIIC